MCNSKFHILKSSCMVFILKQKIWNMIKILFKVSCWFILPYYTLFSQPQRPVSHLSVFLLWVGLIFKLLKICYVSNILYFSLFKYLSLQQYPSIVEEVITNIVAVDLFIFFHNMIYKCTYRLCACILLYQKQFYPRIYSYTPVSSVYRCQVYYCFWCIFV